MTRDSKVNVTPPCNQCRGKGGSYVIDYGQEFWHTCVNCAGSGVAPSINYRIKEPVIVRRKPVGRTRLYLHTRPNGQHYVHFYDKTGQYQPPIRVREKDIRRMIGCP